MDYCLIALDLDGSLLTHQKRILPESLAALLHARAAGLQVMVQSAADIQAGAAVVIGDN